MGGGRSLLGLKAPTWEIDETSVGVLEYQTLGGQKKPASFSSLPFTLSNLQRGPISSAGMVTENSLGHYH
jgi:hypothetical protein